MLHEVSESDLTHELPRGIGGEPWEWVPPTDADVVEVVSLNSGVVAVLTDGVVALDGRTGEVRWTYRALEREVAAGVSPDLSTVLLAVESPEDEETELIGLDAVQVAFEMSFYSWSQEMYLWILSSYSSSEEKSS